MHLTCHCDFSLTRGFVCTGCGIQVDNITWVEGGDHGELNVTYTWQSCIEIKGYSVVYFDRIAAFEALDC